MENNPYRNIYEDERLKTYILDRMEGIIPRDLSQAKPPQIFHEKFCVQSKKIGDCPTYVMKNKNCENNMKILFIHGGAFISSFSERHWNLLEDLLDNNVGEIFVPDYPLVPEFNHKDIFSVLKPIYRLLSKNEKFLVLGDSAGGTIGLSLCLQMKDYRVPNEIILLSPWLDLTCSNPKIDKIDKIDPILHREGLKLAALAYAGDTEVDHSLISPINGNLNNLGKISIYTGTHDIFNVDANEFRKKILKTNTEFEFHEYKDRIHVWMNYNNSVAAEVRKIIISSINSYK